jgi:predicted metal-dependent peptidase
MFSFIVLDKRELSDDKTYNTESLVDELKGSEYLTAEEVIERVELKIQKDIYMTDGYAEMNISERRTVTEKCLSELIDAGYIVEDSVLFNEKSSSYTFLYACNIIGGIKLKD